MFAIGIAIGVIFVSLIGAAIVLAFAGFKGKNPSNAFGIYIGFVAAVFALLAVLGFVGSAAMIVGGAASSRGGRPVPVQQQPGGGQLNPGGQQGPGSGGGQGPMMPGGPANSGRGGPQTPSQPSQPPSASATPLPATPQAMAPDQTEMPDEIAITDDSDESTFLSDLRVANDDQAPLDQVRGQQGQQGRQGQNNQQVGPGQTGRGRGQAPGRAGGNGRGAVLIGIAGMIGSLIIGLFSVFLFLWSLDLTGRRPWRKNRRNGAHSDTPVMPPYDPSQTQAMAGESTQTAVITDE